MCTTHACPLCFLGQGSPCLEMVATRDKYRIRHYSSFLMQPGEPGEPGEAARCSQGSPIHNRASVNLVLPSMVEPPALLDQPPPSPSLVVIDGSNVAFAYRESLSSPEWSPQGILLALKVQAFLSCARASYCALMPNATGHQTHQEKQQKHHIFYFARSRMSLPTHTGPWYVFRVPFLTSSFNDEVWRWLHSYPGHEWTILNRTMVRDALRALFILLRVAVRDSACNGAAPCQTWMFMCTIPCTVVPTCNDISGVRCCGGVLTVS